MTFAQFVTQVLATLAALGPVIVVLSKVLQPYVKDARLAQVLDVLSRLIAAAVASEHQLTVRDLKSSERPGAWTPGAGFAAKSRVIHVVKDQAPDTIEQAKALGIQQIDVLLSNLVEKHVVEQKAARIPPVTPADALPVSVVEGETKP